MTIARTETGFRELDMKIAICLGAGLSGEETAGAAGCNRSTVYDRKNANGDFIEAWAAFTKRILGQKITSAAERIKAKYEEMYEKAVSVVDQTMDDTDDKRLRFQAATRVIDEVKGRPTQRIETRSEQTVTQRVEVVQFPSDELRFLLGAIRSSRAILTGNPPIDEEVITVETLPVDGE
ncbi:MAG: hypothetical protein ACTHQM_24770 [Thermoanaerobaculia bacterium]